MQRLVILWLTVGLLTRATHARHNITAALVALAPVLDNDQETALSMDGRNESSVLSVDWILLLVATAAQFLLVLHHRWIERNTNTYHDFHWETGKDSNFYTSIPSHTILVTLTRPSTDAYTTGRTASLSCASFYAQRRARNASNWWQSARDEAATRIAYVASVSVWFQSKRKTEERVSGSGSEKNVTRFKKLPSLLPAPFFERSLTLVPRSFLRNRTERNARYAGRLRHEFFRPLNELLLTQDAEWNLFILGTQSTDKEIAVLVIAVECINRRFI